MKLCPIPKTEVNTGWQSHPIVEKHEPFIEIKPSSIPSIKISPQYYLQGYPHSFPSIVLRKEVVKRLFIAQSMLPEGIYLLLLDGWRPYELQLHLYQMWKNSFIEQFPDWSEVEIEEHTQKYVSKPSINLISPSPHATGGSVDVTLSDNSGNSLYMGNPFDDMSYKSHLSYFEESLNSERKLTSKDKEALLNRRLLYYVMVEAGFTAYKEEWWHFDYGNQWWGKQKGEIAFYGGVYVPAHLHFIES